VLYLRPKCVALLIYSCLLSILVSALFSLKTTNKDGPPPAKKKQTELHLRLTNREWALASTRPSTIQCECCSASSVSKVVFNLYRRCPEQYMAMQRSRQHACEDRQWHQPFNAENKQKVLIGFKPPFLDLRKGATQALDYLWT
jgi:hypothetical protein